MGQVLDYPQTFSYKTFDAVSTKIKVLCLSIWYPLSISRYFEKALRARYNLDVITTGPYTSNWIPWMGGMSLPEKYAKPPDIPLPFPPNIEEINYDMVKAQLPEGWIPDIVLTIDAGIRWKYKPSDGIVVHVATDPHVLNYDPARKISDKFFNMQLCYSQKDDIYLPYAYSAYDHYPESENIKDTDAVLIGMPYEQRTQWANQLRAKGVSVIFENGPVFDEARALYNRGRIGLNWSSLSDLNARVFEIPAMKLCPVVNFVPDMAQHFSLARHLTFSSLHEAVEQVMWAKEHPEDAQALAELAYQDIQGETYDTRVSQILMECDYG